VTLPTGTLQRQLQQGLNQLRTATDNALTEVQTFVAQAEANAQTEITDSQDDRAQLHTLVDWLDQRLAVVETQLGITPPPNPTTTPAPPPPAPTPPPT
jgi:ubiquinone biosynthesis protein UbiJ